MLAQFRYDYNPRIAVTVDMIATGTDVKPLECLLFMRDVKSREYLRVKSRLSDDNGVLHDDYQEAKAPFVDGVALEAMAHFSDSNGNGNARDC